MYEHEMMLLLSVNSQHLSWLSWAAMIQLKILHESVIAWEESASWQRSSDGDSGHRQAWQCCTVPLELHHLHTPQSLWLGCHCVCLRYLWEFKSWLLTRKQKINFVIQIKHIRTVLLVY